MPEQKTKKWYKSKIIWFNVVAAVLMGASHALPAFQPFMTAEVYAVVLGVVNVGLRVTSSSALT